MKKINNVILSILFSISFFFVVLSLTVLNKHFMYKVLKENDYYNIVVSNIKSDINDEYNKKCDIDIDDVEKDIKSYIKYNYNNNYYKNKIKNINDEKVRDIYNYNIRFNDTFINHDAPLIIGIIYFICFILIIVTGIYFNKTKGNHDISVIITFNFIFSIFVYGLIYLFLNFDFDIFNIIKESALHYYLAYSIILFELILFRKYKKRIKL